MCKYIRLKWDTDFFGFRVAKLIPGKIQPEDLPQVLYSLKKDSFKLVYFFVNPSNPKLNKAAKENQGVFVDEKVTYFTRITKERQCKIHPDIIEYQDEIVEDKMIELSLQSGEYSRFKKDPHFNPNRFTDLYTLWIKNSVSKKIADSVLVYKPGNLTKGFITLALESGNGKIGLIGVDRGERGKNIGSELIKAAKEFFLARDIYTINVVTQGRNIAACKFYEKNGFYVEKKENVYHFWL
jgi:dTDP-4-amino-4,6-dideoxy-D-galactose acyltransferase